MGGSSSVYEYCTSPWSSSVTTSHGVEARDAAPSPFQSEGKLAYGSTVSIMAKGTCMSGLEALAARLPT